MSPNPDGLIGLSQSEAERLLAEVGPNALPSPGRRRFRQIVAETVREPMFLLMLGGAVLYLVVGDVGEGFFLVAAALVSIGLVVMQETRSENALAALQELAQPHAKVIRDGMQRVVAARDLVPGDLLLVSEGERLPADALMLSGDALQVDEATLTGESAPVAKVAGDGGAFPTDVAPGAELSPYLFAGTLVVRGQAAARVMRTGARSALGKIGASLARIAHEQTPLQKTAGRLVALLGAVALAFCALVAVAYGVLRQDWFGGALAGITVAISLVPEEFPMALAVFLALGAQRLAAHRVLARRSAVIETLGAASVLCVDKTGTLTENRMRVARLYIGGARVDVDDGPPEAGAAALRVARLASAVRPLDPMDRAIDQLSPLAERAAPARTWPLKPDRMAVVQIFGSTAAAKGAPEAVFHLCKLTGERALDLHAAVAAFAQDGLRVLGVASAQVPDGFAGELDQLEFRFEALIGFIDPLRPDAAAALQEARAAGVKVVMITGDHPATALATAKAAGIDTAAGAMTGPEIAQLPFQTLCEMIRKVRVFARIVPEQKLLLVEAFRADGEVVAMTGDGVNDAPALEAAHIGIAMGRRGTDVAREAADLVLLDDSFASIVGGVRLGRRIFANLRNALTYITAIHVPIAGLALAPILLGMPPLLYPMHVVLLELAIDPTCALVFEAERSETQAMRRPPRRRDEPLFGTAQIAAALLQGAGLLAGVFWLYVWALGQGSETEARGAAFLALVLGNLALALADSMSSGRLFASYRRTYWAITGAIAAILLLVFSVPSFAAMFAVAMPQGALLWTAFAVVAGAGGWAAALRAVSDRWAPPADRTAP